MAPENEIRTAKIVQYRNDTCAPTIADHGSPESPPTSRPNPPMWPNQHEIRKYGTIHPIVGEGFGHKGRETYVSCLRHGFGVDMARRVIAWELENPQVGDELAPTDEYLARNVLPWDTKLPRPNLAPAVVQLRPYPPPSSVEPPPKYRYPASTSYVVKKLSSHPPLRKMKKLNLRSWTASPPPRPSCEALDHYFTKTENVDVRRYPPVSYLTKTFRRDETYAQEAKERLEQRRREQEKEEVKQEKATEVIKYMDDVPDYIKDLARKWREKYPGPDKLFRKDFDFGPRAHIDEDDDYRRPVSPRSSPSLAPDVSPEYHSKSLKRQVTTLPTPI